MCESISVIIFSLLIRFVVYVDRGKDDVQSSM